MISSGTMLVMSERGLDPAGTAGPGKQVMTLSPKGRPKLDEVEGMTPWPSADSVGLRTAHGRMLWCSMDQRVALAGEGNRKWRDARNVEVGMEVVCFDTEVFPDEIVGKVMTYDQGTPMVEIKTRSGMFFAEGILCRC